MPHCSILVIGAKNCGKTSFIDFLNSALLLPSRKREKTPSPPRTALAPDSPFTPHYLETEVDHERIGVTLWDSQGLEKKFVDLQLREMSSFLESKFEETFTEEQKVVRAPGVRDTHIHCVFLILDPTRLDENLAQTRKQYQPASKFDEPLRLMGVLDEDLDVQVLKTLQGKTTVIPVISKADTITTTHMAQLKKAVWDSLKQAKLDPLDALHLADDDVDEEDEDRLDERDEDAYYHSNDEHDNNESDIIDNLMDRSSSSEDGDEAKVSSPPTSPPKVERGHQRSPSSMERDLNNGNGNENETPYVPMSIISPDSYEPGVVGRKFPWGFADPYNVEHCDFVRLKDSVFSEWRAELREASREVWYEGWRTSRLKKRERTGSSTGATPRPSQGQYRPSPAVQMPGTTSPEMMRGAYRQGVNAF
jgi:septin family protein